MELAEITEEGCLVSEFKWSVMVEGSRDESIVERDSESIGRRLYFAMVDFQHTE
jgi:hypothetical protein